MAVTGDSDAAWEAYGALDPYYGVLNEDRFRGRPDAEVLESFFESGERHVASVLEHIRKHIVADFQPRRALDFGCGVGRLVIPLARVSGEVVGVDVSEHMLAEARVNVERAGLANVDLVRSTDDLRLVEGTFDLIHTFIVMQHISPRRGEVLAERMLEKLEPGGVGALHFTYHRRAPLYRRLVHRARGTVPLLNGFVNLLQKRPFGYPLMKMHEYDLGRLCAKLQAFDCTGTCARFTDHGGHLGAILYFQRMPRNPPRAPAI
jgi:SAM-dependent methyltransferase